jgi:hypothetical protein
MVDGRAAAGRVSGGHGCVWRRLGYSHSVKMTTQQSAIGLRQRFCRIIGRGCNGREREKWRRWKQQQQSTCVTTMRKRPWTQQQDGSERERWRNWEQQQQQSTCITTIK